jgi:Leucine-rich repeat (LRR) protein
MKITLKLLLVIFLFVTCSKDEDRQITTIPDSNFEQSLIELGIDNDGTINQQVFTSRISTIDSLDVHSKNISNLTGIEDFTSLIYLDCGNNQLINLNVRNNTSITDLICWGNQLKSVDVSINKSLTRLICHCNQLTTLDVTNNPSLECLICYENQLTSLDVTNNPSLGYLFCCYNQLTSLDVSNNTSLISLKCQCNRLTCITVNQTQLDDIPIGWEKDSKDTYSLDCN